MPLWVSQTERAQIEALIPAWVDALLAVRPDLHALSTVLSKPLRPLWLSPDSRMWLNHIAPPASLPFTPVFLLSASMPTLYQRRTSKVVLPRRLDVNPDPCGTYRTGQVDGVCCRYPSTRTGAPNDMASDDSDSSSDEGSVRVEHEAFSFVCVPITACIQWIRPCRCTG